MIDILKSPDEILLEYIVFVVFDKRIIVNQICHDTFFAVLELGYTKRIFDFVT